MAKITIEYCSSYDSYNGEKVTEGKVLAPVLISDAEFQSNNTIIPENLRTWKHYGVPFYTLGPSSTIDFDTPTGDDIHIELRDPEEVKEMWYKEPMALPEVKCYNPAFDVTDHTLISGIVTEKGICRAPYTESLAALFQK